MKPLKLLFAAALALGAALVSAAESDPPSVVGRLSHLSGPVSFAPAQANEDWVAATLNRPVTTGDRLWTDTNGRAEMHVGSLAIRMAPQTSMDVLNLDDENFQLRVAQGAVNLRVRRLASDKLLEIATPGGAVVVKQPGSYRVNVDPSGAATMVAVRNGGEAEVYTGNSTFTVHNNQEAEVSGTRQGLYAAPAPDDFDRWAAERDRRTENVASTRYVPEEMTGYEDLDEHGTWHTVPTYGAVWRPRAVPVGWAPYRHGHWVWVSPWGWTWVDDAPWGFAPSHYGRWVWFDNHWAWAPGHRVARPVYAPALVAFIGGSNFSVSLGIGSSPAVGWVPLGWGEPYRPWYRASHAHVRNVNVTHVTNVTNITNVTNVRLVNRNAPSAVTVVSRENFVGARRVQQAALNVPARQLAAAPVTQGSPVATPVRTSLAAAQPGSRPPAEVSRREAVAVNAPPAARREAVREAREDRRAERLAESNERPRVRVIDRQRQERIDPPVSASTRAAMQAEAPRASAPAQTSADAQRPQQPAPAAQPDPRERAQQEREARRAEGRAPAPPAATSARPTFDREMRPSAAGRDAQSVAERRQEREERREARDRAPAQGQPQPAQAPQRAPAVTESRRDERQVERRERTEQANEPRRGRNERSDNGVAPQPMAEAQRAQQEQRRRAQAQEQQRQQVERQAAQQQQAQQQAREQQARAREAQQRQMERQLVQQHQEVQRRQAAQQQAAQRAQQQRAAPAIDRSAPPQRAQQSQEKGRERERARAERS